MPQSLSCVFLHLTFSTKERRPFLRDRILREKLHAHLGSISKKLSCEPIIVGGVEDHVHVLARLGREASQSEWVKELKRVSSAWMKEQGENCAGFSWQAGYAVFSVGPDGVEAVRAYIARQEEHHHGVSFQDELRRLLRAHGLAWDEKYLWD